MVKSTKIRLKRGERIDTYLSHVCSLLWSVELKKQELSAIAVAFIRCRFWSVYLYS